MRNALKILAPALAIAAASFALAAPSVHEVSALGLYDQTTQAFKSGSDHVAYFYYQPASLGLTLDTLAIMPEQTTSVTDLIITGINGDAGFTPTLNDASIVKDANGQALVKLGIDIATTTDTGSHNITILAKNTTTGQNFELPLNVWVQ